MTPSHLVPLLSVADVAASVEFYTRVLGFEQTGEFHHEGQLCWAYLRRGGAEVMFGLGHDHDETGASVPLARDPHSHRDAALWLYCDDVLAWRKEVLAAGGQAAEPVVTFYGLKEVWVTDPDGFSVVLSQATDEPPTPQPECP